MIGSVMIVSPFIRIGNPARSLQNGLNLETARRHDDDRLSHVNISLAEVRRPH